MTKSCDRLLTERQINETSRLRSSLLSYWHSIQLRDSQHNLQEHREISGHWYTSFGASCNHNKRSERSLHDRHEYPSKRRKPLT